MKHQQDGNTEEQFRNPVTTIYATTACAIMVQKMASARGHVNGSPDVYTWKETIEMADEEKKEKVRFDWTDVLAFTIAAYQVIFPFLLGFVGIILVLYLLLYLWAG